MFDAAVPDAGVDASTCAVPPVCSNPGAADKACVDGTIVDFGNDMALLSGAVELSMLDSRTPL